MGSGLPCCVDYWRVVHRPDDLPPRELTERERLLLSAHREASNIWASAQPRSSHYTPVVVVERWQESRKAATWGNVFDVSNWTGRSMRSLWKGLFSSQPTSINYLNQVSESKRWERFMSQTIMAFSKFNTACVITHCHTPENEREKASVAPVAAATPSGYRIWSPHN